MFLEQAQEVHHEIRQWLKERLVFDFAYRIADYQGTEAADETRIIYGGSVNAKNSTELSDGSILFVSGLTCRSRYRRVPRRRCLYIHLFRPRN